MPHSHHRDHFTPNNCYLLDILDLIPAWPVADVGWTAQWPAQTTPSPHQSPGHQCCHTRDWEHRHYLETETLISGSAESREVSAFIFSEPLLIQCSIHQWPGHQPVTVERVSPATDNKRQHSSQSIRAHQDTIQTQSGIQVVMNSF